MRSTRKKEEDAMTREARLTVLRLFRIWGARTVTIQSHNRPPIELRLEDVRPKRRRRRG